MTSVSGTLFFEKPDVLYIDEDDSVKPPLYGTIDRLMESLKENGPLVAVGKMGPAAYTEDPFKLRHKVNNQEVHGWKPDTFKNNAASTPVILLGAKKTTTQAYVYFTLANDITLNNTSLIRGFTPLDTDTRVYIMSYENFLQRSLVNLHPICPHGQWLFSVSADSILDGGDIQAQCKKIGQKIFDHYKIAAKGDSNAGQSAVIRICEAAQVLTAKGAVRQAHIATAWDGIGDTQWRWQA